MSSSLAEFADWQRNPDGIPIPPTKVPLKAQEIEEIEIECTGARVRVFKLNSKEDIQEYEKVLYDLAHQKKVRVGRDLEEFLKDEGTFLIVMRYIEIQGKIPKHIRDMEAQFDG